MMFFTDWEGPWVLTDFAYEVAIAFFNNHEFFERLSQYDDYLFLIRKKDDYEAGDTLRLLAPFLVALGIDSRDLIDLAEKVLKYTPDAEDSLEFLKRRYEPVVVSTSYRQFLDVSARGLGIEKVYGTEFFPEKYRLPSSEREEILQAVEIISTLPEIYMPPDERSMKAIEWLDEFFWKKMMRMEIGKVLRDVRAVGGRRKLEIVRRFSLKPVVIGDSISDLEMLSYAKVNGLAVSFNGNEYAVENSNVIIISESAWAEAYVLDSYFRNGIDGVKRIKDEVDAKIYIMDEITDIEDVVRESKDMRKRIRGIAGLLS